MSDNIIIPTHASDFYYDYDRGYDRRKSKEVLSEVLKVHKKKLIELHGQYAILDTNGGHVCASGLVLPNYIPNDEAAKALVELMYNHYDRGHTDGQRQLKKSFRDLMADDRKDPFG